MGRFYSSLSLIIGYCCVLGSCQGESSIKLTHFKLLGSARQNDNLMILTPNAINSYGVAYLGSTPTASLGLSGGAHIDLFFTMKIGGKAIGHTSASLPDDSEIYMGKGIVGPARRRRLTGESPVIHPDMILQPSWSTLQTLPIQGLTDEQLSEGEAKCVGLGFGVQVGTQFDCLAGEEGLQSCGDAGFFFITADNDEYSPGIYSVSDNAIQDFLPNRDLFESRITQVKVSFSPSNAGPDWTMAQLYINGKYVLDPLVFKSAKVDDKEAFLIFSARTVGGCSQEHLLANVRVDSDAVLPDSYSGLLKSYLENPSILDDLRDMDKSATPQSSNPLVTAMFEDKMWENTGQVEHHLPKDMPPAIYQNIYMGVLAVIILFGSFGMMVYKTIFNLKQEILERSPFNERTRSSTMNSV